MREAPIPLRPPRYGLLKEARTLPQLVGTALRLPELLRDPRSADGPVLVVPGFGAGDASTLALRGYLSRLGYRVEGWALGRNRGDVPDLIPRVVERTRQLRQAQGRPVRLVGWSLGGYLARETAREAPELVERVVTLGTPVVGGPKYTAARRFYERQGEDLDAIEREVERRYQVPIPVPIHAIFSESDGVVAWEACIDRKSPDVEHVRVRSSHAGLGFCARVYRIVADRLARPRATCAPGH